MKQSYSYTQTVDHLLLNELSSPNRKELKSTMLKGLQDYA